MANFADDLRRQADAMSGPERRGFMRVMGEAMKTMVKASFLGGRDPDRLVWRSPSEDTQHGGRWSARYRRASGGPSADSIRLKDSGALMRSYRVKSYDADQVTVGPPDDSLYEKIAERAETPKSEGGWGNDIVGWGYPRIQYADMQVRAVLDRVARGEKIGRIRLPNYGGL